jgi:hypothetical protein
MEEIFGFRVGQPIVWFHKNATKSNQNCFYCGDYVGSGSEISSDKEHLIGREFVPKGSLDGASFNFIFRACQRCNGEKSAAERHISSVTLLTSPARQIDGQVNSLAMHKASRDFHPHKKGVLVKDAGDEHVVEFGEGGMTAKFTLVGPPQLDQDAVNLLACNHVQGIFAMCATEDPRVTERSKFLPASYLYCFGHYIHRDWGNPHIREITRRVVDWPCCASIVSANGYFKLMLKKCVEGEEFFWALEWNKSLRIVGAICSPSVEPKLFSDLPDLGWRYLPDGSRTRREVTLADENDSLFTPFNFEESDEEYPSHKLIEDNDQAPSGCH